MISERKQIVLVVLLAAVLVSVSFVPLLAGDSQDEDYVTASDIEYDYVTAGWTEDLGNGWDDFKTVFKAAFAAPFYGLGDLFTDIGNAIWNPSDDEGYLDDDPVKEFARGVESDSVREKLALISLMGHGFVSGDIETWKLTGAHLNRLSEISAGNLWKEGDVFNSDNILHWAGVYDLLSSGMYNTQYVLDWAFDEAGNRSDIWSSKEWASSMSSQISWDGGSTGNASSRLNLNFSTIVTSTSAKNLIYLDTDNMSASVDSDMTNGVWAFSGAGSLTLIETGYSIPLYQGYNDVSDLPSGWYKLSSGVFAGPFLSSTSNSAASAQGGAVILCDSSFGYVVSNGDATVTVVWNGVSSISNYLRYGISHDGVTDWTMPQEGDVDFVVQIIDTYGRYYEQLHSLLFKSAESAQVMWRISATAKQSNIFLSPSSVIPVLENADVDANHAYSLYVGMLRQIAGYYGTYGEILEAGQMKMSAESLDLYCFGTLYNGDGTVLASNVIFTPYTYLHDFTILSGHYSQFGEDGAVMIWDRSATSAASWIESKDVSEITYIEMNVGSYFVADEVYYLQEPVSNVTLKPVTVNTIEALAETSLGLRDTPELIDVEPIYTALVMCWAIIIGLLGAICVILSGKNPVTGGLFGLIGKVLIVVAIVVFILGLIFPVQIAQFVLGVFW